MLILAFRMFSCVLLILCREGFRKQFKEQNPGVKGPAAVSRVYHCLIFVNVCLTV